MSASTDGSVSTVRFHAADGAALVGDLVVPEHAAVAAIVCHPHPQFGGDRFNHVVTAIFERLPAAGIAALRFDFRGDFTGGVGERLDAIAALDHLAGEVPEAALVAVGYSFGAMIALGAADPRVTALALVAPPLAMATAVASPRVPTLVLTPAHDQFSAPAANAPIVDAWPEVDHRVVAMADHSLVGHTASVADQVTAWLSERRRLPSPL
jgi:uncharacterized protein